MTETFHEYKLHTSDRINFLCQVAALSLTSGGMCCHR